MLNYKSRATFSEKEKAGAHKIGTVTRNIPFRTEPSKHDNRK
uniref:Uncharacterized protein n=1 Tax=Arundo donax TaxID=35708 RepID=A0A0A9A9E0_ARUDO